jgi:hypothetical protein
MFLNASSHPRLSRRSLSTVGSRRKASTRSDLIYPVTELCESTCRGEAVDFDNQQSIPVTIRYAIVKSIALDLEIEPLVSQMRVRGTGIGDTVVGTQWLVTDEGERRPAVAVGFDAKLPTASRTKQLGTGRTDHRLVLLLSRSS